MAAPKRSTVYLEEILHQALRLKAAMADRSISDLVNEAVRLSLKEDALDIEAVNKRSKESSRSFESFVGELKKNGKL